MIFNMFAKKPVGGHLCFHSERNVDLENFIFFYHLTEYFLMVEVSDG